MILAGALQLLWKMLGTVQFICHLPYTTIGFPSNAKLAFDQVMSLANLKIIPIDTILEQFMKLKLKANKETGGYSSNFFESTGFILLALVFGLLLFGIGVILKKFVCKSEVVKKILMKLYDMFCFNFFIRTFIAGYLVWAISAFKSV